MRRPGYQMALAVSFFAFVVLLGSVFATVQPTLRSKTLTPVDRYMDTKMTDIIKEENPRLPYNFGRKLGNGSFGVVVEAERRSSGEKVAIKIVRGSMVRANLPKEYRILHSISHPNVAGFLEIYSHNESSFIVMELMNKGTLAPHSHLMSPKPVPLPRAKIVKIIKCLLNALAYLHKYGIIHRDIKPDNIMVGAGDEVKLIDFGLASEPRDGPVVESIRCGSRYFSAPEIILSDNVPYGTEVDIWSVGMSILSLLTHPYPEIWHTLEFDTPKDEFKYLLRWSEGPWSEPVECGEFTETFLKGCLQWKPERRQSASHLISTLKALQPSKDPSRKLNPKVLRTLDSNMNE